MSKVDVLYYCNLNLVLAWRNKYDEKFVICALRYLDALYSEWMTTARICVNYLTCERPHEHPYMDVLLAQSRRGTKFPHLLIIPRCSYLPLFNLVFHSSILSNNHGIRKPIFSQSKDRCCKFVVAL